MRVWGGRHVVVSVPHGAGWLPLHMRGSVLWSVYDQFSFDIIILRRKEEANKGGGGTGGGGICGGLGGLVSHKELGVA